MEADRELVLNLLPHPARGIALQQRVDDAVGAVAIFESSDRRRHGLGHTFALENQTINFRHDIAKGIRPAFLMSAGQVSVLAIRGA